MSKREYQRDLMDASPQVTRKMEPGSAYRILHELGPSLLRDEDFAEMYADREGCPSHPPSMMAGILLLQRHADVSDQEATDRLQFDLRWQHALRLPMDFPEIPHSNLSHFRSCLIVHELEGQVFDRLVEMATEAGVVDPGEPQAIDSSHIFGAAAVQDTYELLQDGTRKLLETALEEVPEEAETLIEDQGIEGRLSADKPDTDWTSEEERREWGFKALSRTRASFLARWTGISWPTRRRFGRRWSCSARFWLRTSLSQARADLEGADLRGATQAMSQAMRPPVPATTTRTRPTRRDPIQRKGHVFGKGWPPTGSFPRSTRRCAMGASLHRGGLTDTRYTSPRLSIASLSPEWPSRRATSMTGRWPRSLPGRCESGLGRPPSVLIGDSHYGSPDLRMALEENLDEENLDEENLDEDVEVVAKLPTATGGTGERFDKTDFEIDLGEGQATCPAGQTTETIHQARDHKDRPVQRFQFDGDTCAECPLRRSARRQKMGKPLRFTTMRRKFRRSAPTTRPRSLISATASARRSSGNYRSFCSSAD